jgi:tetratricopeptide (TPR) repeat protein
VVAALYEALFLGGTGETLRRRALRLAPLLLTMLIVPFTLMRAGQPAGEMISGGGEPPPGGYVPLTRGEYLLTQFRVAATYMRLLFLPVNQNIDYDYPVYTSFFAPEVFLPFLLIVSLFGLGVLFLYRSGRGRPEFGLIGFGVLWFFATLSVESSVIPIPMLINEYRLYLPSAGAFLAIAAGGVILLGMLEARKALFSVFMLVPLVLALAAHSRNAVWASEAGLWEDVVAKSPGKLRAHYNLGVIYHERGKIDEALKHYKEALGIMPDVAEVQNNIGVAYLSLGMPEKAIEHNLEALRLKPDMAGAHNNLGLAYTTKGFPRKAEEHYLKALELRPGHAEAHNNLGTLYGAEGRLEEAVEHFQKALRIMPGSPEAHRNLGIAYRKMGLHGKSDEHFQRERELSFKGADRQ